MENNWGKILMKIFPNFFYFFIRMGGGGGGREGWLGGRGEGGEDEPIGKLGEKNQ